MDSWLPFVFFACLICAAWTAPTGGLGYLAGADHMIKCGGDGGMLLPYNLTGLERVDDCQPLHRRRVKRTALSCNVVYPRNPFKNYFCISNSPKLKCYYYTRDGVDEVSCSAEFGMLWSTSPADPGAVLYASAGLSEVL